MADEPTRIRDASLSPTDGDTGSGGLLRLRAVSAHVREAGPLVRYEIGALLGRGGVGEVQAAHDVLLRREVALKRLREDRGFPDEAQRRFLLEAQVAGQLEHPGIPPVYDLGVGADGAPFFTMRRVHGRSLADAIRSGTAGTLARRLEIFLKVCEAVGYAHARGVVHRDLKPANVMVGDHGEVLVLDWGLAKLVDDDPTSQEAPVTADADGGAELTSTTSVVGTPAYMAPEQALGQAIDARTDVYALGALLYALLAGRSPFDAGPDLLERVRRSEFPRPRAVAAEVPVELEAVVLRAMARVPVERSRDVAELQADIEAWLDGREVAAASYTPWTRAAKWTWRHRRVLAPVGLTAAVGSVLFVVAVLVFAVSALRTRDRALRAEDAAEVRLAEGEVALGLALSDQGRVREARDRLRHARTRLAELGAPTLAARVAASWVEHRFPRPLVAWSTSDGVARLAPDGRSLVTWSEAGIRHVALPTAEVLGWRPVPEGRGPAFGFPVWVGDELWTAWHTAGVVELGPFPGPATVRLPSHADPDTAPLRFHAADLSGRRLLVSDDRGAATYRLPSGEPDGVVFDDAWLYGASADLKLVWGRARVPGAEYRIATEMVVWDGETGEVRWRLPFDTSFSVSDEGLALERDESTLFLRASPGGPVLWSTPGHRTDSATFVAAGREVLVLDGVRAQWLSTATGRPIREIPAGGILTVPNGGSAVGDHGPVLIGFTGRSVEVFGTTSTDLRSTLGQHPVFAVAIAPGGLLALAGDGAGAVHLLDAGSGLVLRTFPPETADEDERGTRDVAFAPDVSVAYAADRTGEVRVIDLVTGAVRARVPPPAEAGPRAIAMAVHPLADGSVAIAYDVGVVARWDPRTGAHTVASGLPRAWDVAGALDGRFLVVSGRQAGTAFTVVDARTGAQVGRADTTSASYRVAVSGDGRVAVGDHLGRVSVWQLGRDGRPRLERTLDSGPEVVMAVAYSPDGAMLATGTYAGRVVLWEVASGTEMLSMRVHDSPVEDLAFSTDGARLMSAADEGEIGIVELFLAERLDALVPVMGLDDAPPDPARRLLDLAEAADLRREPSRSAHLYARARAAGARVPALAEARVLWASGSLAPARERLQQAARAHPELRTEIEAWLAAE